AVLGAGGLRVYARERGWAEVARDGDYGDHSCGVAFAPDGRLATTAWDGKVRLYAAGLAGDVRPAVAVAAPGGPRPFGIAFSPDGSRLAVGYTDSVAVTLLEGAPSPRCRGPTWGASTTQRQYDLAERARALGWADVTVIDDDLGRSGSGVSRLGFERLLAAICEGRVGAVFAIEASRLARNGHDPR
ncbi:MAG: recombinase family protein, partial [Solirubrobacterales bacterium]|nr:recombinase family protein [Solirubrobacterales bacterium]